MLRFIVALVLTIGCASAHADDFETFKTGLWPDAHAKGIARATFDLALRGVTPDPRVIAATKRQPEYGKPVGDYINALASPSRIQRGRDKAREWAKTFDDVEKKFAVERWVLLALWGMETDYGAAKDRWDVFRSLSTLAYTKYRHPYFRNELLVAMKIMQEHRLPREQMVSSWAGAMGQTQFMPSNFVDYAIDFSGDGKPDIWNNVADVLGSTGNYLHKGHWIHGLPWGFEVAVPHSFDTMTSRGSFADWAKRGLKRADGKPFPPKGDGILFSRTSAAHDLHRQTDDHGVRRRRATCEKSSVDGHVRPLDANGRVQRSG